MINTVTVVAEDNPWTTCAGSCGDDYRLSALQDGICFRCRAEIEEEKRQEARERALDAERELLIKTMLDVKGWEEFKFENYDPVTPSMKAALEEAQLFDPHTQNIFFCGSTGCGKTHLAGAIFRNKAPRLTESKAPPPFEFGRAIDILRRFRGRRVDEEELMRRYVSMPLLVIDDLGAEKDTDHANQIIYEILDRRIMARRHGLVVTTNLGLSDMAAKSGSDRASSRLNAMCRKVYIEGPDMRMRTAPGVVR